MPGGVNSPVRAFKSVGGEPVFIERGEGPYIYDVDGNRYIDYVCSWGPLILGHAHPDVIKAVRNSAMRGTSFGAPCPVELELGELIKSAFPSIELLRMVNSGTEAVMSAVRLARAFTGRKLIVKFQGCYHGHSDFLLGKSGSGIMEGDIPGSPGVPAEAAGLTVTLPYNSVDKFIDFMAEKGEDAAAVIVEPVAGNMGVIPPARGFLEALRTECYLKRTLLIFDEVITGFRLTPGGAQQLYDIRPDLTCLGKIIGGGLPVGCFGGRRDIMEMLAPQGPVYQAGTLSGNPVAMSAGVATIKSISRLHGFYKDLSDKTKSLTDGLLELFRQYEYNVTINRAGSMFTVFFAGGPVTDYDSAAVSDKELYSSFFHEMLEAGVYFGPSRFEAAFVSGAHSGGEIEFTVQAAGIALENMRRKEEAE